MVSSSTDALQQFGKRRISQHGQNSLRARQLSTLRQKFEALRGVVQTGTSSLNATRPLDQDEGSGTCGMTLTD